jgi:two-component system LytT family response regulator
LAKIVIIDDQDDSVEKLSFLLHKFCGNLAVSGVANSGKEAIALINKTKPDIVFLDVEMDDMNGFEVLERLDNTDFKVIFTTAYDKYAIQAIRFSALDYLLKPIQKNDLMAALERAKQQGNGVEKQQVSGLVEIAKNKPTQLERIGLTTSDGLVFKNVKEIIHCESDRNYTLVHLVNNEKLLVSKALKEIDETLEGSGFFRIHNSFLINLSHVKKYVRGDGGHVIMSNNKEINVSRSKKDEFLELFSKF